VARERKPVCAGVETSGTLRLELPLRDPVLAGRQREVQRYPLFMSM
jgi:hypothetical protein